MPSSFAMSLDIGMAGHQIIPLSSRTAYLSAIPERLSKVEQRMDDHEARCEERQVEIKEDLTAALAVSKEANGKIDKLIWVVLVAMATIAASAIGVIVAILLKKANLS
jgi:hypothetical protein